MDVEHLDVLRDCCIWFDFVPIIIHVVSFLVTTMCTDVKCLR